MPRIQPVSTKDATGATAEVLAAVKQKMGGVPNMLATMAHSPAVANSYLAFSGALGDGQLPAGLREQIALTVGQANHCQYCLSAHSALGKGAGLSPEAILEARQGTAPNSKDAAAVAFARRLSENRGWVDDSELAAVREAGWSDGEIGEMVAHVALNTFTNYFNHVSDPEVDFPAAPELATV